MSFQIHNKEGQAISINDLDKEASEFWELQVNPKYYASKFGINWFDSIGYQIHSPSTNYTEGWNNVKASLWSVQCTRLYSDIFNEEEFNEEMERIKKHLKPFFDLIDYWEAKGYIPIQVKN